MPDNRTIEIQNLLTYKQAAAVLGVHERTIWLKVKRRELPAIRFSGSVQIAPDDLQRFIEAHRTTGAGATSC